MTSEEVRQKFFNFFKNRRHAVVPSSSLLPDDPSVLLTTAGMQQFKKYYTGEADAGRDFRTPNTVSIQKCFRTSDITEVGDDSHLTFFEMLGNFSFGGYFKKEAIAYAHDFIVQELGLPISYVTVFKGSDSVPRDEEARAIWNELGVKDVREEGMADVFWGPTGAGGPCGPTTEIYCRTAQGQEVEIWNIVFNQYFYPATREELLSGATGAKLEKLSAPGVDTGMGFERLMMVLGRKENIFATDLFAPLFNKVQELSAHASLKVQRILADHLRAAVFLAADGVRPANKEAGYILRRLLRRALAYQVAQDIRPELFPAATKMVREKFARVYPNLSATEEILEVLEEERRKFQRSIALGLREISRRSVLTGADAFYIYETFGLPFELILEFAPPAATTNLKRVDFEAEFEKHQVLSRAGAEKKFGGHGLLLDTGELKAATAEEVKKVTRLHTATHLLQQALREVLGEAVRQAGSDITAQRTRFDFTFSRRLTPVEMQKVENIVNGVVRQDLPVQCVALPKVQAEKTGALYFFREKYPEQVKIYFVGVSLDGAFSKEFCGGPHVTHTGEVGIFRILKEEAVGAGTRRIRATVE